MKPIAKIEIHVVPRAKVTAVAGLFGEAMRVKVAAPPVDGAANDELVRFITERLRVARGAVTIARGHTARRKMVVIEGISTEAAMKTLLEAP